MTVDTHLGTIHLGVDEFGWITCESDNGSLCNRILRKIESKIEDFVESCNVPEVSQIIGVTDCIQVDLLTADGEIIKRLTISEQGVLELV